MKALIGALIAQYGCTIEIVSSSESTSVTGFLQPVTSKSWQNMDRVIASGGEIPRGQYLYIGPPDVDITGAEHLSYDGKNYLVRRADAITFQNERLYIWGLCVERGREDPWRT
ncbi:MAG: hypothetical protein LBM28_01245 [Oscillospiraceae bacterium]|jgi:hypothetical protein|nr:hypothetical protein [Oscillospiraceae bacterium]